MNSNNDNKIDNEKDVETNNNLSNKKDDKKSVVKDSNAYRVLIKPLSTEKAADLVKMNKYFFEVDIKSNKIEIAKVIEEVYGVKPISIETIRLTGKRKRRGRVMGKRRDWKKAIVTLKKGDSIKIYEGV